jgi:hypothetical protein
VLAAFLVLSLTAKAWAAQGADPCGMGPGDWCPAPPGDACGRHRDAASCKADPACTAMPYRGESVVACQYDKRGFPTNCPVVGCISPGNRSKS